MKKKSWKQAEIFLKQAEKSHAAGDFQEYMDALSAAMELREEVEEEHIKEKNPNIKTKIQEILDQLI